jgi:FKBP-type peptidyl-prolyl cis-trans isomerase SlyD
MSNESEAESADSAAGADEDTESGLQTGDFVRIDYTARTVDEDMLVDTTSQEVAEEEGIEEEHEFSARTIVLGEGHIFDSVEDAIIGGDVGDEGSVVVPTEEAFGTYDEAEVRTVSKDKIPEDDRYPGAQVQIEGEDGRVETIIGGRARVNFNHPLAGDDIEYDYEIVDEVEDREAQAEGLIEMLLDLELDVWFETDTVEEEQVVEPNEEEAKEEAGEGEEGDEEPAEPETETVEVDKESLYIEAVPQLTMNQQWMMGKQQIAQQLIDLIGVDRVVIQETIEGGGMGMPGMMGGMGGAGGEDLEAALEDADVDAEELAEELE